MAHTISIEVNFPNDKSLIAFWSNLHGGNDVLSGAEEGVYVATGHRVRVDIDPSEEDRLADMVSTVTSTPRAS